MSGPTAAALNAAVSQAGGTSLGNGTYTISGGLDAFADFCDAVADGVEKAGGSIDKIMNSASRGLETAFPSFGYDRKAQRRRFDLELHTFKEEHAISLMEMRREKQRWERDGIAQFLRDSVSQVNRGMRTATGMTMAKAILVAGAIVILIAGIAYLVSYAMGTTTISPAAQQQALPGIHTF